MCFGGEYGKNRAAYSRYALLLVLLWLGVGGKAAAKKAATPGLSTAECLSCHNDASLSKDADGKAVSLYVAEEQFKSSTHGSALQCADCHQDIRSFPHDPAPAKVDCATCHADQQSKAEHGIHAKVMATGGSKTAGCIACHGGPHELLAASEPHSKVNRVNIPQTCGACHGQQFVMEASGLGTQPFFSYQQSVHGRAVTAGSSRAAVCTDCHGTHEILSAKDSKSPISKFNVPQTCGQCHEDAKTAFMNSSHGRAVERGNWQAPVCTDCHGIHLIKARSDGSSPAASRQLAVATCERCHEGVRLSQEFGILGRRAATYRNSYHGLASRMGSSVAANCASCHGAHSILPSSDPQSTVNKANLINTCGRCHPGANENFTTGKIHIDAPHSADIGSTAVRWIRSFYLSTIAVVIAGMLLHNLLAWRRKALTKKQAKYRNMVRMPRILRYQHLTLIISFTVLAITGFLLRYPDSWFAAALPIGERARGLIHRVAGVVLIGDSLFHLAYLIVARSGRRLFQDMLPRVTDLSEVLLSLSYYLGIRKDPPKYGRFHYAEKVEYLALLWGMCVMAVTGLALWFKMLVGFFAPRWILDAATAIHFYEAILATLAIMVWHSYQVIFDPDVYPMNWAWYDGMAEDHDEQASESEPIPADESSADAETVEMS